MFALLKPKFAGDVLEYFIADGDGTLPPGIQLTTDGRLVGVVEPILALDKFANSGRYDTNVYGTFPFDFGIRSADGYDSFFYDLRIYDDSIPTKSPRKLNRYYEFTVSVQSAIVPVDVVALRTNLLCVVLSTSKGVPTMLVPSILSPAGKDPDIIFTDEMVKLVVFKGNAIVVDTRSANTPNS